MSHLETQSEAFICVDCSCIFHEPKLIVEKHGLDSPPYEIFAVCPQCGGSFTETKRCDFCNEYIVGSYVEIENGHCYCGECYTLKDIRE